MKVKNKCFNMKYLTAVLLLAIALCLPQSAVAAAGMTHSKDTQCTQDDVKMSCATKEFVNVGVSYGVRGLLDVSYFNTEIDDKGIVDGLEETLRFEMTKSEPRLIYPLRYLHTVDYAPYEQLIKTPNSSAGIQSCNDGEDAVNPTCGWVMNNGVKIADSQGFCSNRDLLQLKACSADQSKWRGEEDLGAQSTLENSFSIGHCLRNSNISFRGYEIDPPRRSYGLTTDIFIGTVLLNRITLSPEHPVVFMTRTEAATGHAVLAELLGEDKPSIAPPDLSGYILYVPSSPADHPMVTDWKNNMLLVPREMVTMDGSECNKVGVGYKAFRSQADVVAKTKAGDCLANQLYQLHQEDLSRLTQNPYADTKYLVRGKKMFKGTLAEMNDLQLLVRSPELSYSTVSLDLDEAVITQVTNQAVGFIKTAYIKPFPAMSKEGTLAVVIKNAGTSRTDYIVSVRDCVPNFVGAVPAQARTMSPAEEATLEFDIAGTGNTDSSNECWVLLTAADGREFDKVRMPFATKAQGDKYPQDLQLKNNDTTTANGVGKVCSVVQLKCDIDYDMDIDHDDIMRIVAQKTKPVSTCPLCDVNGDGQITVSDVNYCVSKCTYPQCAVK